MLQRRRSGVLLHPTSLPSRFGSGDLGPEAIRFLRFLEDAGQTVWQVLPLGITDMGLGNSPYSSPSAFAGNPRLVSPENLIDDGLLEPWDFPEDEEFRVGRADFIKGGPIRDRLLECAFQRFFQEGRGDAAAFRNFRKAEREWVEDFALYMALKKDLGNLPWYSWPPALRFRVPEALNERRRALEKEIERQIFGQFLFFRQWQHLREEANARGILLFGDLPIYVSSDSADVWADPDLFQLDGDGLPLSVAGVPPDYFSEEGQLWGNPLYDWEKMAGDGFNWWMRRLRHSLDLFDRVRIDHFRGLLQYWSVQAGEETAVRGQWEDVPSNAFFNVLRERFPQMPFVAENLGIITPDVTRAMEDLGVPGMRVLLFAFGGEVGSNPYAPHNHHEHELDYTGTHDNNTVRGWWQEEADEEQKERVRQYLGYDPGEEGVARAFVRMALSSVSRLAVMPLQDLMGLGSQARMNRPSVSTGNWEWRVERAEDYESLADWLQEQVNLYGRHG